MFEISKFNCSLIFCTKGNHSEGEREKGAVVTHWRYLWYFLDLSPHPAIFLDFGVTFCSRGHEPALSLKPNRYSLNRRKQDYMPVCLLHSPKQIIVPR